MSNDMKFIIGLISTFSFFCIVFGTIYLKEEAKTKKEALSFLWVLIPGLNVAGLILYIVFLCLKGVYVFWTKLPDE